jgi:hypothetical protein
MNKTGEPCGGDKSSEDAVTLFVATSASARCHTCVRTHEIKLLKTLTLADVRDVEKSFLPKCHEVIAPGRALEVIFRSDAWSARVFICLHVAVLISKFWLHELALACPWRRVSKAKIPRNSVTYLCLPLFLALLMAS